MSKKIELVQAIGNEVCEDCGPDADCGDEPEECGRIANALDLLNNYIFTSAHEGASKGQKGHNEDRLKFSSLLGRFERAIRSRNEYECDDVRKEVKEFTNEYFPNTTAEPPPTPKARRK